MATATKTKWTHKVVKSQRDSLGQWFCYPAAAKFATEAEAAEYAERFAAEQAGVSGTLILVIARNGDRVVREIKTQA